MKRLWSLIILSVGVFFAFGSTESTETQTSTSSNTQEVEWLTIKRSCNLRSDHNTDKPAIGLISAGSKCKVLQHWNAWSYVNCSGTIGWVGRACAVNTLPTKTKKKPVSEEKKKKPQKSNEVHHDMR